MKTDPHGNIVRGPVAILESSDCLAFAGKAHVGLLGVHGLVVVQTPDAILVCDRAKAQEIKKLVNVLPRRLR